jgi:AcrR family transcriptional regulator
MSNDDSKNKTRTRLIMAGWHLFGHNGYEGTSTRALAGLAKTNIASITYHFGSKAGLRTACAVAVAKRVSQALDAAVLDRPPETAQQATAQMERLIRALIGLIIGAPEAADMVTFMLRELTGPADIKDTVYTSFIEPRHKAICALWATATGRAPDDKAVKLAVFALIGQVIYFRIASAFVARRMCWDAVGPDETRQIEETVIASLRDALERHRI